LLQFGQRNNLSHTEYFTQPDKFFDLVFDNKKNVPGVSFFGDSVACATYTVEDEFLESLNNTNHILASFVTAQARLKLHTYLEKLDRRVLYMDTGEYFYTCFPNNHT